MSEAILVNVFTNDSLTKCIDHNNQEDRVWLGRHCWWAFRNGHSIKTVPLMKVNMETRYE